jgi:type II secretory pathway pseudopilin PulG
MIREQEPQLGVRRLNENHGGAGAETRCIYRCKNRYVRRNPQGFILLTTLLIIAMVGLLTVGLSRHSLNLAVAARTSEKELQQKWGAASCQRFAMGTSSLLSEQVWDDASSQWKTIPVPRSANTVQLGESLFTVVIEDESGKFNINRSLDTRGRQATASLVRRFARNRNGMVVQLRTLQRGRGPMEDQVESWAQVFQMPSGSDTHFALPQVTQELTCWGQQLNYKTATPEVFVETVNPLIGAILTQKLQKILSGEEAGDWETELAAAGANAQQINAVKPLLVASSRTQAVWVESAESNRIWLTISEEISSSIRRIHSFNW